MNMLQFELFASVARTQNISRTAGQYNVSQPAVSHQLKTLEQAMGLELIHRTKRGVVLTDAGRELLIRPYRNYPWDCVMRYAPEGETAVPEPPSAPDTSPEKGSDCTAVIPAVRRGDVGAAAAACQAALPFCFRRRLTMVCSFLNSSEAQKQKHPASK